MVQRNRAEGWKHAKRSGHDNEILAEEMIQNDPEVRNKFLTLADKANCEITSIKASGLKEKNVESILGGMKTKSKTDLYIFLDDGSYLNVSIKKSGGGQVYLISTSRFINGFEKHFRKLIPHDAKKGMELFWGSAHDTSSIIEQYGNSYLDYETRKNRIVADTLLKYDKNLYFNLLKWFSENIILVTEFCFSRGLAKNETDWADIIWYINKLEENDINEFFPLKKLYKTKMNNINYGSKNGGTTIQLPFGFVQWHQGQMQYHHNYYKIKTLYNELEN